MIEHCGTFTQALDSIRSLDELEGYAEGLKQFEVVVSEGEWAAIAEMKIKFQKRASTK